MARGAAEVPDIRIARAGEERIAGELVAGPFADHGAGGVADVVLVEAQQRAEAGMGERRAHARQAIVVQPAEVNPLLEVHLGATRRLQRPVPAVMRIDVVRTNLLRLRRPGLLRHSVPPRGEEILAGRESKPPPQSRRRFAIARRLRTLELHREPGEQRPSPALRGGKVHRGGDALRRDSAAAHLHTVRDELRQRLVRRGAWDAPLKVVGIGALFRSRVGANTLEAVAAFENEGRNLRCTADQLGTRNQIGSAGRRELGAGESEFLVGALRVAGKIALLKDVQGAGGIALPLGRGRRARARCEKQQRYGKRISVLRSKGHLRLISSINAEILRTFASTSARSVARSLVAAFALPLICSASARMPSARFSVSRTSPSIVFACATAFSVDSMMPPGAKRRWSVLPITPFSDASSALVSSSTFTSFCASCSLPSNAPSAPCFPAARSAMARALAMLACRLPPAEVSVSMLSRMPRMEATSFGISSLVSPRSTGRSASSASGGSFRSPVCARMVAPPIRPYSSVNTDVAGSQCASARDTSIRMRARPRSSRETRRTRPMGKPEKLRSMPIATPSALSVMSVRRCVSWNTPRA